MDHSQELAEVLARLYHLTGDAAWRQRTTAVLGAFGAAADRLSGMPTLLAAGSGLVRLDDGRGAVERAVWRVVAEVVADRPAVQAVVQWLDELGPELTGRAG